MKKFCRIMACLLVLIGLIAGSQVVDAQSIPCSPNVKGLHYNTPVFDASPALLSNLPYDILQCYIIADSILRSEEARIFTNDFFKRFDKKEIAYDNDTLNYAYKYLYKISDYDPLLFWEHLRKSGDKKIHTSHLYDKLTDCIEKSPNGQQKRRLFRSFWILHIYVDTTIFMVYDSTNKWHKDFTIVYAQVLDTIKGKIIPNINTAYIYEPESDEELFDNDSPPSIETKITLPNSTNLVFDYCNQWLLEASDEYVYWNGELQGAMKDKDGNPWIKPKKEYIVLLAPNYECSNDGQNYYALWPVGGSYPRGMHPIENGNVIDEKNVWGWGNSVPINVFKQNLNAIIDSIKNYGE